MNKNCHALFTNSIFYGFPKYINNGHTNKIKLKAQGLNLKLQTQSSLCRNVLPFFQGWDSTMHILFIETKLCINLAWLQPPKREWGCWKAAARFWDAQALCLSVAPMHFWYAYGIFTPGPMARICTKTPNSEETFYFLVCVHNVRKTLTGYKRERPLPVLTRSRSRLPRGIPLNGVPHGGVPSQ